MSHGECASNQILKRDSPTTNMYVIGLFFQHVIIFNNSAHLLARRAVLIGELMASELTHVEALKTVVVEQLEPLKSILSKDVLKKLFGNFEVIVGWNMQFLIRLKARHEESEDVDFEQYGYMFGDIMVEMVPFNFEIFASQ